MNRLYCRPRISLTLIRHPLLHTSAQLLKIVVEILIVSYVIEDIHITGWPKKVSHCQIMKKIVLNRIKVCQ